MSSSSETFQFRPPTGTKSSASQQTQAKSSVKRQATQSSVPAMLSSTLPSGGGAKSHKVEGKNKKSLHQKQQQQQRTNSNQNCVFQQIRQQQSPHNQQQQQPISTNPTSRGKKNNSGGSSLNPTSSSTSRSTDNNVNICSTLEDFSRIAQELKADINRALAKQASHQNTDQPVEVVNLKNDILKLSGLEPDGASENGHEKVEPSPDLSVQQDSTSNRDAQPGQVVENDNHSSDKGNDSDVAGPNSIPDTSSQKPPKEANESSQEKRSLTTTYSGDKVESSCGESQIDEKETDPATKGYKSDSVLNNALDKLKLNDDKENSQSLGHDDSKSQTPRDLPQADNTSTNNGAKKANNKSIEITPEEFAPLNARLDFESKLVTLTSSLQSHFLGAPQMLDPICRKLVSMSDSNSNLVLTCENYRNENRKLLLVKQKLENLCRELQKSNNEIRIESLDLIKAEQGKAKEQTTKIQSTLSGVIKLFDENQQRNMSLRQENQDLQTKLKSLLDHCDNWEKSIEAALRQRDIENRLLKTELAKANLLKNEEQEKFLGEKQELLQILSMMQEQQHRIEGQEAKLRSDLSSYASKYDECQAVISKGMSRFQTESKRMLKQIEKSRQDYKVLLTKYENTNKRTTQLLEEKQEWHRSLNVANKKIETLERLCRALSDRKQEAKSGESIANNPSENRIEASD